MDGGRAEGATTVAAGSGLEVNDPGERNAVVFETSSQRLDELTRLALVSYGVKTMPVQDPPNRIDKTPHGPSNRTDSIHAMLLYPGADLNPTASVAGAPWPVAGPTTEDDVQVVASSTVGSCLL